MKVTLHERAVLGMIQNQLNDFADEGTKYKIMLCLASNGSGEIRAFNEVSITFTDDKSEDLITREDGTPFEVLKVREVTRLEMGSFPIATFHTEELLPQALLEAQEWATAKVNTQIEMLRQMGLAG
jgi:hypothetical protein